MLSILNSNLITSSTAQTSAQRLRTGPRKLYGRNNTKTKKVLTKPKNGPRKIPKTTKNAKTPRL